MPPQQRSPKPTEFEIELRRNDHRRAEFYGVGIELSSSSLRLAVLPWDATPTLDSDDVFERTAFFAAGQVVWQFAPVVSNGRSEISAETAQTVLDVLRQFFVELGIEPAAVRRIRVGGYLTFDGQGSAVRVNPDRLQGRLQAAYPTALVSGGSRIREALRVETAFGAGRQLPAERMLYLRVSAGLNLDATVVVAHDGVFARGIRHQSVDGNLLEQLGKGWLGAGYELPPARECHICHRSYCLHTLVSGQGIVEQIAGDDEAVRDAMAMGATRPPAYAQDRGALVTVNGQQIDSAGVFKAAAVNETCARVILQAGLAMGITIWERLIAPGAFEPDLIVIGGTVPFGTLEEDQGPLADRRTIDGFVLRALRQFVSEEQSHHLRVTRSRFAGYTGLLGLTVSRVANSLLPNPVLHNP